MSTDDYASPKPIGNCVDAACSRPLFGAVVFCPFCGASQLGSAVTAAADRPAESADAPQAAAADASESAGDYRMVNRVYAVDPANGGDAASAVKMKRPADGKPLKTAYEAAIGSIDRGSAPPPPWPPPLALRPRTPGELLPKRMTPANSPPPASAELPAALARTAKVGPPPWVLPVILAGLIFLIWKGLQRDPCETPLGDARRHVANGEPRRAVQTLSAAIPQCQKSELLDDAGALLTQLREQIALEDACASFRASVRTQLDSGKPRQAAQTLRSPPQGCTTLAEVPALRALVDRNLNDAAARLQLARTEITANRFDAARNAINGAEALDRDNAEIPRLRAALERAATRTATSEAKAAGPLPTARFPPPALGPAPAQPSTQASGGR